VGVRRALLPAATSSNISHEFLAMMLGSTRPTVTSWRARFRRLGSSSTLTAAAPFSIARAWGPRRERYKIVKEQFDRLDS
jgi:hypothetical protein